MIVIIVFLKVRTIALIISSIVCVILMMAKDLWLELLKKYAMIGAAPIIPPIQIWVMFLVLIVAPSGTMETPSSM